MLAQRGEVGKQGIEAQFEVFGLEGDAATEHTVVQNFQAGVEVLEAVMVLRPAQACRALGNRGSSKPAVLTSCSRASPMRVAQVAQLQATLQRELPGHHRGLTDTGQATDAFDQVGRVLREICVSR